MYIGNIYVWILIPYGTVYSNGIALIPWNVLKGQNATSRAEEGEKGQIRHTMYYIQRWTSGARNRWKDRHGEREPENSATKMFDGVGRCGKWAGQLVHNPTAVVVKSNPVSVPRTSSVSWSTLHSKSQSIISRLRSKGSKDSARLDINIRNRAHTHTHPHL